MAFSFISATTVIPFFLMTALLMVSPFATPVAARDSLKSGQWLKSGESLEKVGSFTMMQNCTVVLSDSNKKIIWWATAKDMDFGCNLKLQHDGDLVMYNSNGALWSSQSNRKAWKIYYLILREDHNVVINDGDNSTIWEADTSSSPQHRYPHYCHVKRIISQLM
ncbi:mannose-specific lectin-like [Dendrobium catenatum]|uniref:Mannose-specific lectin n=1 Tax=Dendrobium catenatum TaxID=906689 RepID=A0A2I0XA82_9ASPA|nr:mannose-specific lectin-like [Dendrobium catenatum]PKU84823.1 Mannose-specific lectin [Dendrobium catenatum]